MSIKTFSITISVHTRCCGKGEYCDGGCLTEIEVPVNVDLVTGKAALDRAKLDLRLQEITRPRSVYDSGGDAHIDEIFITLEGDELQESLAVDHSMMM